MITMSCHFYNHKGIEEEKKDGEIREEWKMILNLFDVPKAIFYRKRYKDKQSWARVAEQEDGE